ncbi:MAG: S4 domain-containing protein [Acidiferrobacterales bacterium]|nr:S4 domain-containing protein [Acidiferrobacterales bacterium]
MASKNSEFASVRLDKWLWAARFFKNRTLAAESITRGNVMVNGGRAKSSRRIRVNDKLLIRKGPYEWQVVVEKLSENRGPARDAISLYSESDTSIDARKAVSRIIQLDRLARPMTDKRPDKKERRKLLLFKKRVDK